MDSTLTPAQRNLLTTEDWRLATAIWHEMGLFEGAGHARNA
jgi:hypothetical protein